MPVRPRRQRRGVAPLSMSDQITLQIGPAHTGELSANERHRRTEQLRQHRRDFGPEAWGVRLLNGEPEPGPAPVGMTAEAIGLPQ
jgi:hypothetical protein